VRFVDHEQRPVFASQRAERIVKAGLGRDDADVRKRRLGQHAGDVAVRELPLERCDVVPFDDTGGLVERHRRPEVAFALDDRGAVERGERLVDRAVVAPVEHEHLRARRDKAREPDREAVRVGRRQGELPARDTEAARQLLPHPQRVLAREHQGDPARELLRHRLHDRCRRVTGHRARVAQAEVDVFVPVDVAEPRVPRLLGVDREPPRPAQHPVHGHTAEQRRVRALGKRAGLRVLLCERLQLTLEQLLSAPSQSVRSSIPYGDP